MSKTRLTIAFALVVASFAATTVPASAEIPVSLVEVGPSPDSIHRLDVSVSGDGNWVVSTAPGRNGVVLWNASSRVSTLIDPVGYNPTISDDGRWIAYTRNLRYFQGFINEIVLKDRTSAAPAVTLSSTEAYHEYPDMSGDGSVVAWRSRPTPHGLYSTKVWRRSTGTVEDRLSGAGLPKVSGNGRFVLHSEPDGVGQERWDLSTGAIVTLDSRLDLGSVDISDDGNTIAYLVPAGGVGVYTVVGGGDQELDVPPNRFGVGVRHIAMSGDASTITFTTRQRLVDGEHHQLDNVYVWNPASGALDRIGLPEGEEILSLSADGTAAATHTYARYGYVRLDVRPGTVAAASSVEEILGASDYTVADADLLRLYRAFFDREPDSGGAVYWIDISRGGSSLTEIAEFFTGVAEYRNLYDGTTNQEFLTAVYANVLGREFDQDGYDYWLDLLEGTNTTGTNPNLDTLSRGAVVRWMTGSVEFKNKYPYLPTETL